MCVRRLQIIIYGDPIESSTGNQGEAKNVNMESLPQIAEKLLGFDIERGVLLSDRLPQTNLLAS